VCAELLPGTYRQAELIILIPDWCLVDAHASNLAGRAVCSCCCERAVAAGCCHGTAIDRLAQPAPAAECCQRRLVLLLLLLLGKHLLQGQLQLAAQWCACI
jgi:hypothetical protein